MLPEVKKKFRVTVSQEVVAQTEQEAIQIVTAGKPADPAVKIEARELANYSLNTMTHDQLRYTALYSAILEMLASLAGSETSNAHGNRYQMLYDRAVNLSAMELRAALMAFSEKDEAILATQEGFKQVAFAIANQIYQHDLELAQRPPQTFALA